MASEYVLVLKSKYQQLEKDAQQTDSSSSSSSVTKSPTKGTQQSPAKVAHTGDSHTPQDGTSTVDTTTTTHPKKQYAQRSTALPPRWNNVWDEVLDMDKIAGGDSDGDSDGDDDYDVGDVLQSFKSGELTYVLPILKLMETHANKMTWDHNTGEIVLQGKAVPNSNVVELLKDTLTAELHPIGKMEFFRGLDMINVNLSNIKHPKNKSLLTAIKGERSVKVKESKTKVNRLKPVKRLKPVQTNSTWLTWK